MEGKKRKRTGDSIQKSSYHSENDIEGTHVLMKLISIFLVCLLFALA